MSGVELDTPVQYVKGVGPTRAGQLAQLGIETVEDLLTYFPRRFDLRRQAQAIASLTGAEDTATVCGEVVATQYNSRSRRPIFEATIRDESGMTTVRWFHGGYLRDRVKQGMRVAVSGKVSLYRERPQLVNPSLQVLWRDDGGSMDSDELLPVYPAGAQLSSAQIARVIRNVLPQARSLIPEWFPRAYLEQRGLAPRCLAVEEMHRPEDRDRWAAARRRMAYDECLLMQLGIAMTRARAESRPAYALSCRDAVDERIRARIPFPLTGAQERAVEEIVADLGRRSPMNRLLQGDVGCGKTVVALYASLVCVAARKQVAIMAPTEILARQHHRKLSEYLAGSSVRIELMVGGQSGVQRRRLLDATASGDVDILVGTHALLGEDVHLPRLALVVVDEQHKFGVRQRTGIRSKGYAPHYLVMTATPIPRTLALTVFGDLEVSTIDELPPGRGTTETHLVSPGKLPGVYADIRKRLDAGQQAYFIYPVVSAAADGDLTAAEDAAEQLAAGPFQGYRVGLVHGQMPNERKQRVMAAFTSGELDVLVSSVVVEVGVDVATANVMVIHHAERFGLAQLHQLRGRIGRGRDDAECYLVSEPSRLTARERLGVLVETCDGFKIAEHDLRLRGPGEFFGTRQHGLPELKVADLIEDFELLRMARRDALAIVNEDPGLNAPHHQQLRREMLRMYGGKLTLLAGA